MGTVNEITALPINASTFNQGLSFWRSDTLQSPSKVDELVEYLEKLPKKQGAIGSGAQGADLERYRSSSIAWVKPCAEVGWLYDILTVAINTLNKEQYGLDLVGIESPQYTVYEFVEGAPRPPHYTWHRDMMGAGPQPQRKLSLVLQLSHPSEYEGGDLFVWLDSEPVPVAKERGLINAFPSTTLHRVTPVTAGIRRSLVIWAVGPQFR